MTTTTRAPRSGVETVGPEHLTALRDLVGDRLRTSPSELDARARDASIVERRPAAVIAAASVDDVMAVLRYANAARLAIVTRGAGTSLTGAAVPGHEGSVVLDLARMTRIVEISDDDLVAVVEPGVLTADLQRAAAVRRLFYPPDPASLETSTIGGNLATNAGGPRGLKYGTTRAYVLGLEVVLADGTVARLGARTAKNATGYGLAQLFVGSEGTLGVITQATLRLLPLPPAERTVLASFDELEVAAALIERALDAGVLPASIELLDRRCIEAVAKLGPSDLPASAEAILLFRLDGTELAATEAQEIVAELARAGGARDVRVPHDRAEAERLWAARRAVTPALEQVSPAKLGEDVVVPRGQLVAMVRRIGEIALAHDLPIAVFGHIGDGNLHPNILFDPRDVTAVDRMHAAARDIFYAALSLGGLPSGEHGLGELKKDFLPLAIDPVALALMRTLKGQLDPHGILNPGKVFPDGTSPIQP